MDMAGGLCVLQKVSMNTIAGDKFFSYIIMYMWSVKLAFYMHFENVHIQPWRRMHIHVYISVALIGGIAFKIAIPFIMLTVDIQHIPLAF